MGVKTIKLFFISMIQITMASKVKDELVRSAMNIFEMNHPAIWTFNDTSTSKSLMKSLFANGLFCQFTTEKHLQYLNSNSLQDIIIITNKVEKLEEIIEETSKYSKTLVVFGIHKTFKIEIEIDKKVFLVKEANNGHDVFEAYTINNHHIERKLGRFEEELYVWEKDVERDFVLRRSDFHGLNLRAMTQDTGNDIIFDSDYKEKAVFYTNNQTYLVTHLTSGIFFDVLVYLQNSLNFSTHLYKRSDNGWGYVYPQANGSLRATGMVGDLFFGRADLVVTSLSILYKRAIYIDFLIPIQNDYNGLFIPSGHSEKHFQFGLFFQPFR